MDLVWAVRGVGWEIEVGGYLRAVGGGWRDDSEVVGMVVEDDMASGRPGVEIGRCLMLIVQGVSINGYGSSSRVHLELM